MPIYDYVCELSHVTTQRGSYDAAEIVCTGGDPACCGKCSRQAHRRPFSLDYGVTGLPTRGPILPAPPAPRSTAKEKSSEIWGEMMDEQAHEQHQYAKKYGRGGEMADRHDERPKSSREG